MWSHWWRRCMWSHWWRRCMWSHWCRRYILFPATTLYIQLSNNTWLL